MLFISLMLATVSSVVNAQEVTSSKNSLTVKYMTPDSVPLQLVVDFEEGRATLKTNREVTSIVRQEVREAEILILNDEVLRFQASPAVLGNSGYTVVFFRGKPTSAPYRDMVPYIEGDWRCLLFAQQAQLSVNNGIIEIR
jgi:hypothetical protein